MSPCGLLDANAYAVSGNVACCLSQLDIPCVVVTLGGRGCCAAMGGERIVQTGFSVQVMDTTAADDTFCGVLPAALSSGESLRDAMQKANAAGALACTRAGAQSSIPDRDQLESFLGNQSPPNVAQVRKLKKYCGFG